jgi:hypothetical protein
MGHATYSQLKLEEIPEATPLIEDDDEDEDDWRRALLAFPAFSDFAWSSETPEASSDKPVLALVHARC